MDRAKAGRGTALVAAAAAGLKAADLSLLYNNQVDERKAIDRYADACAMLPSCSPAAAPTAERCANADHDDGARWCRRSLCSAALHRVKAQNTKGIATAKAALNALGKSQVPLIQVRAAAANH